MKSITGKCPADRIYLKKVEGKRKEGIFERGVNENSHAVWEKANSTLTAWSHDSTDMKVYPPDDPCYGCYDKIEFTIAWANGERYEGRYDLHAQEHANIGKSIMSFFRYYLKNGTEEQMKETFDYIEKFEMWE